MLTIINVVLSDPLLFTLGPVLLPKRPCMYVDDIDANVK